MGSALGFFKRGLTTACLKAEGTVPVDREAFKRSVIVGSRIGRKEEISLVGKGSRGEKVFLAADTSAEIPSQFERGRESRHKGGLGRAIW